MKKFVALCFALMLASCIQVDDFGDYWKNATVDPKLQGKWMKISELDEVTPTGQSWDFHVKDGSYEVDTYVRGKLANDDGPLYPLRTIKVGKFTLLARGPDEGPILRYQVEDNDVVFFVLNNEHLWKYLREHYPDQTSFYRGDPDDDPDDVEDEGEPVRISQFNEETAKILASIPDTEEYWEPDTLIRKMKK